MMEAAKALAVVIRGMRRGQGLSQEDMNSLGRSHLSRIERGELNITLDVLLRLAAILEIDAAALVLMATALQTGESFGESQKRLSKQLSKVRREGIDLQIETLAKAGKLPPGRPARSGAAEDVAEAKRQHGQGVRVVEIAQDLGLSEATIRRYLKSNSSEGK